MHIGHASIDGHRVRYATRVGDAHRVPLLILNGLGANIELVKPFIDALSRHTVVIFDTPGVGGSPAPRMPYRPSAIARLAEALLDHLGYASVDVLGVSWGGAIAQQFAFQHASRCRRLVLAATTSGALMVPGNPWPLLKLMTPRRYLDRDHAHAVAGEIYGGALRRRPELVERTFRQVRFSGRVGYYLQLAAAMGWTSLPWLFLLRQPTLIMAGADDPLVPVVNAHIMHRLIPDARLAIMECGHLFLVTLPVESAGVVESFLTQAPAPRRRPRRRSVVRRRSPPARIS